MLAMQSHGYVMVLLFSKIYQKENIPLHNQSRSLSLFSLTLPEDIALCPVVWAFLHPGKGDFNWGYNLWGLEECVFV